MPAIESASASTACQTNDSKFAYLLAGGVLGVIALLATALVLLVFAAFATVDTWSDSKAYTWDGEPTYGYEGNPYGELEDELDRYLRDRGYGSSYSEL